MFVRRARCEAGELSEKSTEQANEVTQALLVLVCWCVGVLLLSCLLVCYGGVGAFVLRLLLLHWFVGRGPALIVPLTRQPLTP